MSVKNPTTHVVLPNQLTVYLRERSAVWQCAYAVDGIWQRMSTGKRDLDEAKKQAHEILVEAKYRKKINQAPITRQFKDISKHVVKRMKDELAAGGGKPIFKDYIAVLDKYLVPFFGKYKIDSIDFALLQQYDSWRLKRMKKAPTYSTVLTHNAALNRVFDEAEQRKFLMPTSRPTLLVKGKKSERRPAFTIEEVGAMRNNFDAWIEMGRADQRPLRAMLRDYVEVLLDTGARPGVELMDLTWVHVELTVEPVFIETGEKLVEQDEVEEVIDLKANRGVFLNIQTGKTSKVGKTKGRSALGRSPTLRALRRIAMNNYGVKVEELLERGCRELVEEFRRLDFQKQIDLVAGDLEASHWNEDAYVIANSFGAYLFLHAQAQLPPYIGKVILLSPIVGEFANEETRMNFIPPRAEKLRQLAEAGCFPIPKHCEIHVGSEDWQSNPVNVTSRTRLPMI